LASNFAQDDNGNDVEADVSYGTTTDGWYNFLGEVDLNYDGDEWYNACNPELNAYVGN
jgi:hypothetical protein